MSDVESKNEEEMKQTSVKKEAESELEGEEVASLLCDDGRSSKRLPLQGRHNTLRLSQRSWYKGLRDCHDWSPLPLPLPLPLPPQICHNRLHGRG